MLQTGAPSHQQMLDYFSPKFCRGVRVAARPDLFGIVHGALARSRLRGKPKLDGFEGAGLGHYVNFKFLVQAATPGAHSRWRELALSHPSDQKPQPKIVRASVAAGDLDESEILALRGSADAIFVYFRSCVNHALTYTTDCAAHQTTECAKDQFEAAEPPGDRSTFHACSYT